MPNTSILLIYRRALRDTLIPNSSFLIPNSQGGLFLKKTVFIKNAAILTVSSLILRFIGIVFKVWLAARIGSEGIGLYQIIFSVYMLAATLVTSGISTAVTRLVADELALGSGGGVKKILVRSIELTLVIALFCTAVLYLGADPIARFALSDMRAVSAVKILAFSLPFMGVSSCFKGYFIARRSASPTAISQLLEQAIRIALVMVLVTKFSHRGLSFTCGAVLLGDTVSEACSALYLWLLYLFDRRKISGLSGRARPPFGIVRQLLGITVPISSGRCLNSLLRTVESILVPKGLSRYPLSGENALSQFGMIKGMALPVLFFPSTLLGALSTLLIPEISEAAARGHRAIVRGAAQRIIGITSLISFIFAAIFMVGGDKIGVLVYKSQDVGFLLKALAPIVPFMYLDSICDGILKGLDQQKFTFHTSISDSLLRLVLVVFTLPRFGIYGFIAVMYVSNLLTCLLNVGRLYRVSGARPDPVKGIFFPLFGAVSITLLTDALLKLITMPNLVYIILLCTISIPLYTLFLFLIGSVSREDIISIFK